MVECAGCVSGSRGFGVRNFNGIKYDVYKVYVAKQTNSFDQEKQDKLNAENTTLMECDRSRLKDAGYKTRVLHEDCGTIHVLYLRRVDEKR